MVEKAALVDLDQELWADYVRCRNQTEVARRHGMSQQSVSDAVQRYVATIPQPERAAYRERCLERLEDLYQAHAQAALERPRTAAVVRAIIMDEARLLGLVEAKVHHQGHVGVDHAMVLDPGPTVEQLLERWRAEGKLQLLPHAQLTRLDGGG
jgi:hypothetical protein